MQKLIQSLRAWWIGRQHPRDETRIVLRQRRVYIFFSRSGLTFGLLLLAMLAGAMNYDLSLAYMLVFMLASMAAVSVLHTFRNLLGITLIAGPTEPGFAGESARFEIQLENPGGLPRHNIRLHYDAVMIAVDIPASGTSKAHLVLPASQRGWLQAPVLMIDTHWPIGVFRSWSYARFAQRALIYPRPEEHPPTLPGVAEGSGSGLQTPHGHDDFAGLRPYAAGDSPRHVAWKAAASNQTLRVKTFHGEASRTLWLTWESMPEQLDTEARLSRLCAWILHADADGLSYGLSLPGLTYPPEHGPIHRERCLAALALFGISEARS